MISALSNNDGIEVITNSPPAASNSIQLQRSCSKNVEGETNPLPVVGNEPEQVGDVEAPPLSHLQLALITIAMALAVFLTALDESIIATAIPKITNHFQSLKDVAWYGSAYMLTQCCFQLHYGKLYTHFNSKIVILAAIAIFELGSLVCATSPSSAVFIVGRAIAGSGAGGIVNGTLIIISKTAPIKDISTYTAAVGSIYGIAAIVGPLLGGVITDSYLTWRWCFYLNLPFGAFSAALIVFLYKPPKEQSREKLTAVGHLKRMDPLGLVFLIGAMICLILGLQFSGSTSWSNPLVIALLVLFGVFLLAFVTVQVWLQEGATLPPRIFMKRQVIYCSLFSMALDGAFYALSYNLPIWFQSVKGTSASRSGIRCLPMIIGTVIFSVLSGVFVTKTGRFAPVVYLATITSALGAGLLTTLTTQSGEGKWVCYQFLVGMGVGLGMQQGIVTVQNKLDINDIPIAISTVVLFQGLGPALLVSITQNVFDQLLYTKLVSMIPGLTTNKIFNSGATEILKLVPSGEIGAGLSEISLALTQSWYVAVAAASLSGIGALGIGLKTFRSSDKVNPGASEEIPTRGISAEGRLSEDRSGRTFSIALVSL